MFTTTLGTAGSTRRVCIAAAVAPAIFVVCERALVEVASRGLVWSWSPLWMQVLVALVLGVIIGIPSALIMRRFDFIRAWHAVAVVILLCLLPLLIDALIASDSGFPETSGPLSDQQPPVLRWVVDPLHYANIGFVFWWIAYRWRAMSPGGIAARKSSSYRLFSAVVCALPITVLVAALLFDIGISFGPEWSRRYVFEAWLRIVS